MTRRRQVMFKIATPLIICLLTEGALRVFNVRDRVGIAERKTLAAYKGEPGLDQRRGSSTGLRNRIRADHVVTDSRPLVFLEKEE